MRLNATFKTAVIIALLLSGFTVYSQSSAPFISQLEGLNDGKEAKITMKFGLTDTDYTIQYRLKNITDWITSSVKIKGSSESGEGTVTGLETNKNYCFRLMLKDSVTKKETVSNEVCSIRLKSTVISDDAVKLEWNKIDTVGVWKVSVVQMDENGSQINSAIIKSLSDTVLVFKYLDCSKKYKFNITTIPLVSTQRVVIKSAKVLVDFSALTTATPLKSMGIASIGEKRINYNILYSDDKYINKFEIYKSTNGSEMIKIAETSHNSFDDTEVDIDKNHYCYAYRHINNCGKKSELSGKSCTVNLSSNAYGRLTWSPFTIQADSSLYKREQAKYVIQLVDASGFVLANIENIVDTTIKLNPDLYAASLSIGKFRVLAEIRGYINSNSQLVYFPLLSYSNLMSLYLVLGNENLKNNLSVFPNPTEEKILINSSGVAVRFVELIDMRGRVIHKGDIIGDTVNLSEFEKGKYILRLYDANKKLLNTKNIVKW